MKTSKDTLLHYFTSSKLKSQKLIIIGCEPKWISKVGRSSFYIDCLEKFDINGFFNRSKLNIRELNKIGNKIRKDTRNNAKVKIGAGGARVSGGILAGFGMGKWSKIHNIQSFFGITLKIFCINSFSNFEFVS